MNRDCVLVDGNNMAHRCWHATGGTSAYAASVALSALVKNCLLAHAPRYAAVALDSPDLWRKARMTGYKAGRAQRDAAMSEWLETLRGLDQISGVPVVVAPRNEADDVLATLTGEARVAKLSVALVTSDHDLWALIDGDAVVGALLSTSGRIAYVDGEAVVAKLGIVPWHVPAYKSLVGDPTDEVPGVPGIGPVWARRLLAPHRDDGGASALARVLGSLTTPPVRGSINEAQAAGLRAYDVIHLNGHAPVSRHLRFCQVRA